MNPEAMHYEQPSTKSLGSTVDVPQCRDNLKGTPALAELDKWYATCRCDITTECRLQLPSALPQDVQAMGNFQRFGAFAPIASFEKSGLSGSIHPNMEARGQQVSETGNLDANLSQGLQRLIDQGQQILQRQTEVWRILNTAIENYSGLETDEEYLSLMREKIQILQDISATRENIRENEARLAELSRTPSITPADQPEESGKTVSDTEVGSESRLESLSESRIRTGERVDRAIQAIEQLPAHEWTHDTERELIALQNIQDTYHELKTINDRIASSQGSRTEDLSDLMSQKQTLEAWVGIKIDRPYVYSALTRFAPMETVIATTSGDEVQTSFKTMGGSDTDSVADTSWKTADIQGQFRAGGCERIIDAVYRPDAGTSPEFTRMMSNASPDVLARIPTEIRWHIEGLSSPVDFSRDGAHLDAIISYTETHRTEEFLVSNGDIGTVLIERLKNGISLNNIDGLNRLLRFASIEDTGTNIKISAEMHQLLQAGKQLHISASGNDAVVRDGTRVLEDAIVLEPQFIQQPSHPTIDVGATAPIDTTEDTTKLNDIFQCNIDDGGECQRKLQAHIKESMKFNSQQWTNTADMMAIQKVVGAEVTGKMCEETAKKIFIFQKEHGLTTDGCIGGSTAGVINEVARQQGIADVNLDFRLRHRKDGLVTQRHAVNFNAKPGDCPSEGGPTSVKSAPSATSSTLTANMDISKSVSAHTPLQYNMVGNLHNAGTSTSFIGMRASGAATQ